MVYKRSVLQFDVWSICWGLNNFGCVPNERFMHEMQYYTGLLIGLEIQIGLFIFHCSSCVLEHGGMWQLSRRKSVLLVVELPSSRSASWLILVPAWGMFSLCGDVQLRVLHFVIWCSCDAWVGLRVEHDRDVLCSLVRLWRWLGLRVEHDRDVLCSLVRLWRWLGVRVEHDRDVLCSLVRLWRLAGAVVKHGSDFKWNMTEKSCDRWCSCDAWLVQLWRMARTAGGTWQSRPVLVVQQSTFDSVDCWFINALIICYILSHVFNIVSHSLKYFSLESVRIYMYHCNNHEYIPWRKKHLI